MTSSTSATSSPPSPDWAAKLRSAASPGQSRFRCAAQRRARRPAQMGLCGTEREIFTRAMPVTILTNGGGELYDLTEAPFKEIPAPPRFIDAAALAARTELSRCSTNIHCEKPVTTRKKAAKKAKRAAAQSREVAPEPLELVPLQLQQPLARP